MSRSALLVVLAVTLVLVGTLLTADSFADFEQRAMTRLFVLAAFDTLIGARIFAAAKHKEQNPANDAISKTLPQAHPHSTRRPLRHRHYHRERPPRRRGDDHDRTTFARRPA